MISTDVDRVVNAVLYEGYVLYPYRPSVKNRHRWTFGGLYPRAFCERHRSGDAWAMQTQCLVNGGPHTRLDVKVRFLHLLMRFGGDVPWQEAVEREVVCPPFSPGSATRADVTPARVADPGLNEFTFPASRHVDGDTVHEQRDVVGAVALSAAPVEDGLFRVTVRVENRTDADPSIREEAQQYTLASTHTILGVQDGEFVSLLDPPAHWEGAAAACENIGTWPVLIGERGEQDTMLSSPIILYDYPEVAPESPGDLFDAGEIDEILTLRILTLTDDEKRAMAALDPRGRALLERTEALTPEQIRGLHGTFRGGTA